MDIPANIIEQAARAHWDLTATIKWDAPEMKELWRDDQRHRAATQLRVLLEAGLIVLAASTGPFGELHRQRLEVTMDGGKPQAQFSTDPAGEWVHITDLRRWCSQLAAESKPVVQSAECHGCERTRGWLDLQPSGTSATCPICKAFYYVPAALAR